MLKLFSSEETLAVILGASDWRRAGLDSTESFSNSASEFSDYLRNGGGLSLPSKNIKDLFDSPLSATEQIKEIRNFFRRRLTNESEEKKNFNDLIVYYVGHGAFNFNTNDYFLLVRDTEEEIEFATAINFKTLATCITTSAPQLRRFILLDCCFAGTAAGLMEGSTFASQSANPTQQVLRQVEAALPSKGTLVFAASSANSVARVDLSAGRTTFTDALCTVLRGGLKGSSYGRYLTFNDLKYGVWETLQSRYGRDAVRPELHNPDQSDGSLSDLPAFPNNATKRRNPPAAKTKAKVNVGVSELPTQSEAELAPQIINVPRQDVPLAFPINTSGGANERSNYITTLRRRVFVIIPLILAVTLFAVFLLVIRRHTADPAQIADNQAEQAPTQSNTPINNSIPADKPNEGAVAPNKTALENVAAVVTAANSTPVSIDPTEEHDWKAVLDDATSGNISRFLKKHPNGTRANEARSDLTAPTLPLILKRGKTSTCAGDLHPYVGYFPFNSAVLVADSQAVIASAAADLDPDQGITVSGFDDTYFAPGISVALTVKRATVVARVLESEGFPAANLKIEAHGPTDLAVPVPDGVKEPLNRRFTITGCGKK